MAKCKYNGKDMLRTTLGGQDLILAPGQEFEVSFNKENAHFSDMVSKGAVNVLSGDLVKKAEQGPPPPPLA